MKLLLFLVPIFGIGLADPQAEILPISICKPDCRLVRCGIPPNCRYGVETRPCECCPTCIERPTLRNRCGGPHNAGGFCPRGLVCLNEFCSSTQINNPFEPQSFGKCYVPCDEATGTEVCQPDCSTRFCPFPVGCRYGTVVPPCECCPVCAPRPDEERCGGPNNEAGYCPKGLVCLDDTCSNAQVGNPFNPPSFGNCFVPCDLATSDEVCKPNCAAVGCPFPVGCKYGTITPPCSCCPICAPSSQGKRCGGVNNSAGFCTNGLVCLDDTCTDVSLLPPFVPPPVGKCYIPCVLASGDEVCQPNCAAVLCPQIRCRYGSFIPPCSCCATCRESPNSIGAICGGPNNEEGNCQGALVCLNDRCRNAQLGTIFEPPSFGKCFAPCDQGIGKDLCRPNCAAVSCVFPRGCLNGPVTHPCECCPVCAPNPLDSSCGGAHNVAGVCPPGLQCIGNSCNIIPPDGSLFNPVGECGLPCDKSDVGVVNEDHLVCKTNCTRAFCTKIACQFGSKVLPCECCPTCLKGPGTPCAGPFNQDGFCAEGLVCVDSKLNEISETNEGPNIPFGECEVPRSQIDIKCTRSCPRSCPKFKRPKCQFGKDKDPCACCGQCAKGPSESCGGPDNILGSCGKGLECIGINGQILPSHGGPGTRSGRCEPYPRRKGR